MTYARKQWIAEKDAWRAVIQLNLVRSVNAIATAVARELESPSSPSLPSSSHHELEPENLSAGNIDAAETASILTAPEGSGDHQQENEDIRFPLTEEHRNLLLRLAPLRAVQRNLEVKLGSGAQEEEEIVNDENNNGGGGVDLSDPARTRILGTDNKPISASSSAATSSAGTKNPPVSFRDITNSSSTPIATPASPTLRSRKSHQEFFVRSHGWKSALQRLRPRGYGGRSGSKDVLGENEGVDPDSLAIARATGDMKALWRDGVVREVVRVRKVRLMDCAELCVMRPLLVRVRID